MIKLVFSTTFYPQIDGQSKRIIQILKDMLRACVFEFKGPWSKYLPFIGFAYNNNYQTTIRRSPFEALYDKKYRSPRDRFDKRNIRSSRKDLSKDDDNTK